MIDTKNFSAPSGGPAFPTDIGRGMTLRDYFAAKAMQGMLAADVNFKTPGELAGYAHILADAMLEARK